MTLPELSIKRHVLALMLSLVLVLFGIISYQRIGVDRFPYIEFPAAFSKALVASLIAYLSCANTAPVNA